MQSKKRHFSKDLKLQILRELELGKPLAQAAREHQIHPNTIRDWRKQRDRYGHQAFQGNGNLYKEDAKIAQLERMIGQQAVEIAFLKRALAFLEQSPLDENKNGRLG